MPGVHSSGFCCPSLETLLLALIAATVLASPAAAGTQSQHCQCNIEPDSCPDGVVHLAVRIRWLKTAEFAGYYAAESLGYWDQECLKVVLLPFDFGSSPMDLRDAQIGIPWYLNFLYEAGHGGEDLLHVSQVFTRPGWRWWTSPVYERSKTSNVRSFADLKGLSMSTFKFHQDLLLHSLIEKHGMSFCGDKVPSTGEYVACSGGEDLTLKPTTAAGVGMLVGGDDEGTQAHSMFGMVYDQLGEMLLRGLERTGSAWNIGPSEEGGDFDVFDPSVQDGLRFPEDGVMVNRTWLESDPGRNEPALTKFLKGLYKGWIFCRDNEAACVDLVASTASAVSPVQQRWAMREVNKLIWPAVNGIGMHNQEDIQRTAGIASSLGCLTTDIAMENHTTNKYTLAALNELASEGFDLEGNFFDTPGHQIMLRFCSGSGSTVVICDESPGLKPSLYIASGVAIAGIVLLWSLYLISRTRNLQKQVNQLTTSDDLDLESPLAKIIDFLRQYQSSRHLWSRPSRRDARKLLVSVIANSGNLTAPDIAHQLREHPDTASDMLRFLQVEYGRAEASLGNTRCRGSSARMSSLTGIGLSSLHSDFPSMLSLASLALDASSHGGSHSLNPSLHDRNRIAIALQPIVNEDDVDATGPFGHLDFEDLDIPQAVAGKVGRDYFMDFVSSKSPLCCHKFPLVLVVKEGLQAIHLDHVVRQDFTKKFLRYSAVIQQGYPQELYHCANHACDVTNRFISLLSKTGLATFESERKGMQACLVISGITSALIHDYKHPQVNNQFLSETGADMAVEFNDQAVAENYSVKQGLLLLQNRELNFIENWKDKHKKLFRNIVIQTVLATDMTRHFDIVSQFTAKVVEREQYNGLSSAQKWLAMDTSTRILTLQMTMKVADLGHCALPWPQHCEWVGLLEEELFQQGDMEKENNTEVSFLMDRSKPGANCGENQIGFFTVIALPLFRTWCKAFPECKSLLQQAESNFMRWQAMSSSDDDSSADEPKKQQH
mmetsp:Transcript_7379/g.20836  ORF Transcript_7379/g.20836 Transcript_7379/m.20836 type:complete len:1000 (-) Transcript_7379:364-3363(-)|eukprot:CAMPEP_0117666468 /NCGR_PEP_ID=MMETSP0804-20121206/10394_1 /TAXON_ID=1074897 /ORGANISM="Tetraselmis astigmatica, Strain CCMP880" /LENGTH=999 /DNA_ID=CAMNT_0005474019 /DNA_START=213 /DNA_END=3212 /DNA_ORIENTATION=+